jgi:hypothetical protein
MNQEISGLSVSSKLTSKPRASMESAAPEQAKGIEASQKNTELRQFEVEMEQINHAFALVKEIRNTLEKALRDLSD